MHNLLYQELHKSYVDLHHLQNPILIQIISQLLTHQVPCTKEEVQVPEIQKCLEKKFC